MLVTFKFVEYNRPDSKHTKVDKIFPLRVRACLLLFYIPSLAPQGIVSPPPLWLWHQRKKGGKVEKGEEGQSEIPGEAVSLVQDSCSDVCSDQACDSAH